MVTFSAYKLNINGTLSHRENLAFNELDGWMAKAYGKHAVVLAICYQTGQVVIWEDNGTEWVKRKP